MRKDLRGTYTRMSRNIMCGGHSVYQNGDWYLFTPDGHGDGLRNVMIVIIIMERLLPCKEYQRLGTPAPARRSTARKLSSVLYWWCTVPGIQCCNDELKDSPLPPPPRYTTPAEASSGGAALTKATTPASPWAAGPWRASICVTKQEQNLA
jgi:hypothetical protein